jgi:hypothetical protein
MGWAEGKGWLQRRSVSAQSDELREDPSLKAFMSYSGPVRKNIQKKMALCLCKLANFVILCH